MTSDLGWASVTPRKCRRHEWEMQEWPDEDSRVLSWWQTCKRCGKRMDPRMSRRGRNNRRRGNAIELEISKQLGLRRVGMYGGAIDAGESTDAFVASVKSGNGYFSGRYWDQLKRMPVEAGQTPILVVTDAPGPGHKRRAYVVVELSDWIALHGPEIEEAA